MRIVKIFLITFSFFIYLIAAACFHIIITFVRPSYRFKLMSQFSFLLIKSIQSVLGIKVDVKGNLEILKEKGNFIIARHVSYVDGLIMGGLIPAIFVSKKEIQTWPLIGQVIAISGTIFVDRKRKNKITDSVKKIDDLLIKNTNIIDFPEGTSTDGTKIDPFLSTFFRSPIVAKAAIVPVSISYVSINGTKFSEIGKDIIYWYGNMNFFDHFWNLLGLKTMKVEVTIYDKINTEDYENTSYDRKRLSEKCYKFIAKISNIEIKRTDSTVSNDLNHNNEYSKLN